MLQRVTRLAPSPTGALHLGNARTFLLTDLIARTRGWRVLLRIDDLDGPRVKSEAAEQAIDDLRWLGIEWDERVPDQSQRSDIYRHALDTLLSAGRAYPCICSRKDVERAASAPHRDDGAGVYAGTCRGRWSRAELATLETGRPACYRVAVDDAPVLFQDMLAGAQQFDLRELTGDFVVFKSDGQAAYQLAAVVDDHDQGVTDIVRGDDLLDSTPRQILLRDLLGLGPHPRHWHVPLVIGPDGRRLAKRHGDTRLATYREQGVPVERLLGLLGYWCGLTDGRHPVTLAQLRREFDLQRLPPHAIVMTEQDEAFLRGR